MLWQKFTTVGNVQILSGVEFVSVLLYYMLPFKERLPPNPYCLTDLYLTKLEIAITQFSICVKTHGHKPALSLFTRLL